MIFLGRAASVYVKHFKFRPRPDSRDADSTRAGERVPTGATTIVRVDPNPFVGEDGPELHPHLRTQLRELRCAAALLSSMSARFCVW